MINTDTFNNSVDLLCKVTILYNWNSLLYSLYNLHKLYSSKFLYYKFSNILLTNVFPFLEYCIIKFQLHNSCSLNIKLLNPIYIHD